MDKIEIGDISIKTYKNIYDQLHKKRLLEFLYLSEDESIEMIFRRYIKNVNFNKASISAFC